MGFLKLSKPVLAVDTKVNNNGMSVGLCESAEVSLAAFIPGLVGPSRLPIRWVFRLLVIRIHIHDVGVVILIRITVRGVTIAAATAAPTTIGQGGPPPPSPGASPC